LCFLRRRLRDFVREYGVKADAEGHLLSEKRLYGSKSIEFISVVYVDLHYARACEWTTAWAYQAFERLCRARTTGCCTG